MLKVTALAVSFKNWLDLNLEGYRVFVILWLFIAVLDLAFRVVSFNETIIVDVATAPVAPDLSKYRLPKDIYDSFGASLRVYAAALGNEKEPLVVVGVDGNVDSVPTQAPVQDIDTRLLAIFNKGDIFAVFRVSDGEGSWNIAKFGIGDVLESFVIESITQNSVVLINDVGGRTVRKLFELSNNAGLDAHVAEGISKEKIK